MTNRWDSSTSSEISFTKEAGFGDGVFLLLLWLLGLAFFERSQYRQIDSNITKHKEILLGTRKTSTKYWKPKHYEFLSVIEVSIQLIVPWEQKLSFMGASY